MNHPSVSNPADNCQHLKSLENIPGLVEHARKHLLATLDARAGDMADGGDLEELRGIFEALHALTAIDDELGTVRS